MDLNPSGWEVNYSALRTIFIVSISRIDPKKRPEILSNRKTRRLESEVECYWGEEGLYKLLRGIIHTYIQR